LVFVSHVVNPSCMSHSFNILGLSHRVRLLKVFESCLMSINHGCDFTLGLKADQNTFANSWCHDGGCHH
jgi:hypothetical protein